jgi:hypothetical protein
VPVDCEPVDSEPVDSVSDDPVAEELVSPVQPPPSSPSPSPSEPSHAERPARDAMSTAPDQRAQDLISKNGNIALRDSRSSVAGG